MVTVDGSIVPSVSVSFARTGIVTAHATRRWSPASLTVSGLRLKAAVVGLRVRNVVMVAEVAKGLRRQANAVVTSAGPKT